MPYLLLDLGMHCHVLVEGLGWSPDLYQGLETPALDTLIARGRRDRSPAIAPERWLIERFGVARQHDWPAAPFRLLADGGTPASQAWMCADPVHLRFEQNRLVLIDCTQFCIDAEEAAALVASINGHFGERLAIHAPQPERWYALLASCPQMETTPMRCARGASVRERPPQGADAMRWQALSNELQMLLHDHSVNAAREARGDLPVNSLWLWGAGTRTPPAARPFQFVTADDALARGLALASGAQAGSLPGGAGAWLPTTDQAGTALAVLDALAAPADYRQADAWREVLVGLEREWFSPLLEALRAKRIGMLTLHLLCPEQVIEVEVAAADLRCFWRRRRPLAAWLI